MVVYPLGEACLHLALSCSILFCLVLYLFFPDLFLICLGRRFCENFLSSWNRLWKLCEDALWGTLALRGSDWDCHVAVLFLILVVWINIFWKRVLKNVCFDDMLWRRSWDCWSRNVKIRTRWGKTHISISFVTLWARNRLPSKTAKRYTNFRIFYYCYQIAQFFIDEGKYGQIVVKKHISFLSRSSKFWPVAPLICIYSSTFISHKWLQSHCVYGLIVTVIKDGDFSMFNEDLTNG